MTLLLLAALLAASPAETDKDKALQALGATLEERLRPLGLSDAEYELVRRGVVDGATDAKPAVDMDVYAPKVRLLSGMRQQAAVERRKVSEKALVERAAQEPGAVKLPSGGVLRSLQPGTGATPAPSDTVRVHYDGRLADGAVFDSSHKTGEPLEFPVTAVIKCWSEGLLRMKVGERARLTCPSDSAYGDAGHPPAIPGGATLIFDVELLAIPGK